MAESNCLQIARELVRIPSVNPDYDPVSPAERNVAHWIVNWAEENGVECHVQPVMDERSNLILRIPNGADQPHVHFNGHMDTVAVDGMTIDPFGGEVRDGKLWGRGAADMKGPLACMLAAGLALRDDPDSWRGTLSVGCMVDEETRFRGVKHMLANNELPDFSIVGEPTGLRVVRGCKGCLRFRVVTRGRSAHSSRPDEGRNAISAMARVIPAIEAFFRDELVRTSDVNFGPSTGSIGVIKGGSGVNIVPEECRIEIDIRLLPGQDWKAAYEGVASSVAGAVDGLDGVSAEVEETFLVDAAFELSPAHELVSSALRAVRGDASEVVFLSCDGSKIAAKGGPCIVLGPGDIAQAHTADEFIELVELEKAVEVYSRLARSLMPV